MSRIDSSSAGTKKGNQEIISLIDFEDNEFESAVPVTSAVSAICVDVTIEGNDDDDDDDVEVVDVGDVDMNIHTNSNTQTIDLTSPTSKSTVNNSKCTRKYEHASKASAVSNIFHDNDNENEHISRRKRKQENRFEKMPTLNEWSVFSNYTKTANSLSSSRSSYTSNSGNHSGDSNFSRYKIEGIVMNHPDPSIPNGTKITIQKFLIQSSSCDDNNDNIIMMESGTANGKAQCLDLTKNETEISNSTSNSNGDYSRGLKRQKQDHDSITNDTDTAKNKNNDNQPPMLQCGDLITSIRKHCIPYRLGTKKGDQTTTTTSASAAAAATTTQHYDDSNDVTPIQRILQVFPDMDTNHIKQHLLQNGLQEYQLDDDNNTTINQLQQEQEQDFRTLGSTGTIETKYTIQYIIESTLSILASQPSYPKSKCPNHDNLMNRTSNNILNISSSYSTSSSTSQKFNYDYSSSSITFPQSHLYKTVAHSHLYYTFPFLSSNGVSSLLNKFQSRYYLTFMYIIDQLKKGCKDAIDQSNGSILPNHYTQDDLEIYQYHNIVNILKSHKLLPQQTKALEIQSPSTNQTRTIITKTTVSHPRRNKSQSSPSITDSTLLNEINYTNHKFKEWTTSIESILHRKKLRKQAELEGNAIECNCCYVECAFEEMVHCVEEGHLFCVDCVRRHAEEQIFGSGKLGVDTTTTSASGSGSKSTSVLTMTTSPAFGELNCMDVNGCTSHFARSALMKALPQKVMEKYDELQANQNLEKVGIKDLRYVHMLKYWKCVMLLLH